MTTILEREPVRVREPARRWRHIWKSNHELGWHPICPHCGSGAHLLSTTLALSCTSFPSKEIADECAIRMCSIDPDMLSGLVEYRGAEPCP